MSQFEEIPSPGRGFQGSRALGGLAACKTLASKQGACVTIYAVAWRRQGISEVRTISIHP